ncbi:MAG TPA: ATP-binding cassette domain-containing protein [Candidatus Excrementavichristensenella intestinipullorum]|nr:ATP-binding cassette domain-containing protein [Candidatus Excrementavichristensenella intestinipullorum]
MIDIQQVSKRFGAQQVLTNVSAHFGRGQITGLVGRNGSGKSVLLKIVVGLMSPDQGYVAVDGRRIGKEVDFAPNTGFIIDRPGFLGDRSGYANLRYLAAVRGKIGKEQIFQAIQQVGLNPQDRKPVGKYSQGMRQRLGIAQALMEDPQLIILDEPMNALDNATVEQMRGVFSELKAAGKTLVITSHDERDIETLCDHVFAMDAGVLTQTR